MTGTRLRTVRVRNRSRSLSAFESLVGNAGTKDNAVLSQQSLSTDSYFQANNQYAQSPFAIAIVTDLSFLGPLGDPRAFSYRAKNCSYATSPWAGFELLFGQGSVDQRMSTRIGLDDN